MYKLLIAESNNELRQALADLLGSEYILKTCADGQQARELLLSFRPDLFLLDLMLPMVDGITLLREAHENGVQPITLATFSFVSDYIMAALETYRVSYVVRKPYALDAMAAQIQALAATLETAAPPVIQPRLSVSSLLLELGLSPKVDGYSYLLTAMPLYEGDPRQGLTKELYLAVGRVYGKSGAQVERCIRTAIHSAWLRSDAQVWARYFPTAPDGSVPRPSNGDFIARIAACIAGQSATHSA